MLQTRPLSAKQLQQLANVLIPQLIVISFDRLSLGKSLSPLALLIGNAMKIIIPCTYISKACGLASQMFPNLFEDEKSQIFLHYFYYYYFYNNENGEEICNCTKDHSRLLMRQFKAELHLVKNLYHQRRRKGT